MIWQYINRIEWSSMKVRFAVLFVFFVTTWKSHWCVFGVILESKFSPFVDVSHPDSLESQSIRNRFVTLSRLIVTELASQKKKKKKIRSVKFRSQGYYSERLSACLTGMFSTEFLWKQLKFSWQRRTSADMKTGRAEQSGGRTWLSKRAPGPCPSVLYTPFY